MIKGMTK